MSSAIYAFILIIGMLDFRLPYLNYWDEAVVFIALILWFCCTDTKLTIPKRDAGSYLLLIGIIILGIFSNSIHPGLQENKIAILKDIFAFIKFPILMLVLPGIKKRTAFSSNEKILKITKCFILFSLIVAAIGYVIDIGVYINDEGRFIKSFVLFFSHPTFAVSSYVITLAVLVNNSIKKNKAYIIMNCILLFLPQRTKGYFILAIMIMVLLFGKRIINNFFAWFSGGLKIKRSYLFIGTVCIGFIGFLIGKDKAQYYFSYGLSSARPALYITGIKIATDFFPLGSGFGTFASSLSGEYYSNIYEQYGISNVDGLRRMKYAYMADTFWPYIYGQFGYIGLICYAKLLINLFKTHLRRLTSQNEVIAALILWVYALFSSTAETFFTNITAVQFALILNLFIGDNTKIENEEKRNILLP